MAKDTTGKYHEPPRVKHVPQPKTARGSSKGTVKLPL